MQDNGFTHAHPIPAAHVDKPAYCARLFLGIPAEPDQSGDAPPRVPDHQVDYIAVLAREMLNDDMEVKDIVFKSGEAELPRCLEVASTQSLSCLVMQCLREMYAPEVKAE